jgi:DNA helicase HerA-like ATPase
METNNVHIKENYGIISTDANTQQFHFLVSPPKNKSTIQKHDMVIIDHPTLGETNPILAEVIEIQSYEEIATPTMSERIGKLLATAQIIGTIDRKNDARPLRKLLIPPSPGSRVYVPYITFVEDTLNRNAQGKPPKHPLHLGKTQTTAFSTEEKREQINYYLDAQNLTQNHTLIAAADGTGKTHLATILIEEIAHKTTTHTIILDPYNEYTKIGKAPDTKPPEGYTFTFTTATLTPKTQHETSEIAKQAKNNQVTILNAQGLNPTERSTYYSTRLETLWKSRLDGNTPPLLVLVEEAENLKGEILDELATDGAKHGLTLILVTSHATELGARILNRMGNQMVGRTTDPEDLETLKNMVSGTQENLANLSANEWVINGANLTRPVTVVCRERYSAHPTT